MRNMSCGHVSMYREANGTCTYKILHAFYVSCIAKDSLKRKARDCVCMYPECKSYQRIHACLYCVYTGCFNNRHIHEHSEAKNHILAVDMSHGHVYCFTCRDYQYDEEFEKIAQEHQLIAAYRKGTLIKCEPERSVLEKHHKIVGVNDIGLRGIINMGNTCYISVILQSLVHAPLFRDYFLTLQHKCRFQMTDGSEDKISNSLPVCFACEISDIVQESFCGKEEPFVPNRLLHLLWTHNKELEGYEQQDAHEFFLKLLDNLHLHCRGSNEISASNHLCKCFIDTIFTGFSKYVYACQLCSYEYSENTSFKHLTLISETPKTNDSNDVILLTDCLTKSLISIVNEVYCQVCEQKKSFNLHMKLKKLPLIMSFHHLCQKKKFIFPEILDMTPYILSPKSQSNKEDKTHNSLGGSSNNSFYLFAVVEHHQVTKESGHYTCYVRRNKNNWFSCNDHDVTPVEVQEVLSKKAYLLFYHKQILEYEDEIRLST